MAISPDYTQVGIAQSNFEDVNGVPELLAGDTPALVTISATVPSAIATAGIAAWTPVRVDFETGTMALAVYDAVTPANTVKPNAITVSPVAAGAPANSKVAVYKAGTFNINALKWPASFTTEAIKLAAFDLASSQIFVKKPYYA